MFNLLSMFMMRVSLVLMTLTWIACNQVTPEKTQEFGSFFDHLEEKHAQSLSIQTNFDEIISDGSSEHEHIALISFNDDCPTRHNFEIKLSARGITRKQFCDFPPLKLNLVSDFMPESIPLDDHPPYKLVTYCKDTTIFPDLIAREYLCYKMLNVLTDKSLRVKSLDMVYQNQQGDTLNHSKGFIIENMKDFAQRMNSKKLGNSDPIERVNKQHYQLIVLFQCMIGNTDWSLSQSHNTEYIQEPSGETFIIPYDFDYSGLVNAYYAKPHPQLPIERVTDRMLQYRGKHTDELQEMVDYFIAQKNTIFNVIDTHRDLLMATDEVEQYIMDFYEILESENELQDLLERSRG